MGLVDVRGGNPSTVQRLDGIFQLAISDELLDEVKQSVNVHDHSCPLQRRQLLSFHLTAHARSIAGARSIAHAMSVETKGAEHKGKLGIRQLTLLGIGRARGSAAIEEWGRRSEAAVWHEASELSHGNMQLVTPSGPGRNWRGMLGSGEAPYLRAVSLPGLPG